MKDISTSGICILCVQLKSSRDNLQFQAEKVVLLVDATLCNRYYII